VGSHLGAAGHTVHLRRTLVDSEEKARKLGFVSSPTIRVNGRDIALELRESTCQSCGELSGCGEGTDCRVWVYQGEEYTEAPEPLIVDAILAAVAAGDSIPSQAPGGMGMVPENLQRFFAGKAAKTNLASAKAACCGSGETEACGPVPAKPEAQTAGSKGAKTGGCGCQ